VFVVLLSCFTAVCGFVNKHINLWYESYVTDYR